MQYYANDSQLGGSLIILHVMNRREFTRNLLALAAAPAIPLPAAGASATAAPLRVSPLLKKLSEHHVHRAGQASAALFARSMGVSAEVGEVLTARLVERGLVSAPNAAGICIARRSFPLPAMSDIGPVRAANAPPRPVLEWKIEPPLDQIYDPHAADHLMAQNQQPAEQQVQPCTAG